MTRFKQYMLVILFGGGLFAFAGVASGIFSGSGLQTPTAPQLTAPGTTTHSMVLTERGFQPRTMTIRKDDTVVFSTTRERNFWPASNLHPTHEIYAAFDPEEPIPHDETWSFTFTETGEWDLHDHLQAHFTGTITVIEPK